MLDVDISRRYCGSKFSRCCSMVVVGRRGNVVVVVGRR